jgi:putative MATE family efflux protein
VSFPIIFLLISLAMGFGAAGTILVSQYKGSKNTKKINYVSAQTLLFGSLLAIAISFIGLVISPILINYMGVETSVSSEAIPYLQISFVGMVFVLGFIVFESLMRGVGDPKTPMLIVLGTVILNIFLDPLFIFGYGPIPAFGVSGAALATLVTQLLAFIVGLWILFRGNKEIKLILDDFIPDLKLAKKMFKLGLPTSLEQSSRSISMLAMVFLVSMFSTETLAAFGIGTRIFMIVLIPSFGIAIATSTLVGNAMGSNKIKIAEKIAKTSIKLGFISMAIIGIILFIFSNQLASFFIPNDPVVIQLSSEFIKIFSLAMGFVGIQLALIGTFRGAGDTKTAMFIAMLSVWALRIPIAFILSRYTELAHLGIWVAFPIDAAIAAIVAIILFKKGNWKSKKII